MNIIKQKFEKIDKCRQQYPILNAVISQYASILHKKTIIVMSDSDEIIDVSRDFMKKHLDYNDNDNKIHFPYKWAYNLILFGSFYLKSILEDKEKKIREFELINPLDLTIYPGKNYYYIVDVVDNAFRMHIIFSFYTDIIFENTIDLIKFYNDCIALKARTLLLNMSVDKVDEVINQADEKIKENLYLKTQDSICSIDTKNKQMKNFIFHTCRNIEIGLEKMLLFHLNSVGYSHNKNINIKLSLEN